MKTITIVFRIISFPFALILFLIFGIKVTFELSYNFLRHGGEFMAFIKKNQRQSVHETYLKLEEFIKNQTPNN